MTRKTEVAIVLLFISMIVNAWALGKVREVFNGQEFHATIQTPPMPIDRWSDVSGTTPYTIIECGIAPICTNCTTSTSATTMTLVHP